MEKNRQTFEHSATKPSDVVVTSGQDIYYRQMTEYSLLTHEQEVSLAKSVQAGLEAEYLLVDSASASTDNKEQIGKLEQVKLLGECAAEQMVTANLRLVVAIANKSKNPGESDDIIQDGNTGLMHAVKKFEPAKGYKFSTYATWWIKQAIGRGRVHRNGAPLRLPHQFESVVYKVNAAIEEGIDDPEKNIDTLAENARVTVREAKRALEYIGLFWGPLRLDRSKTSDNDSMTMGDAIPDSTHPPVEQQALIRVRDEKLERALDLLPEDQRFVLEARFGLCGGKEHTLEEVGEQRGVTRERIRQIQVQALGKLRVHLDGHTDMIE